MRGANLAESLWALPKFAQHLADQLAMMPFLIFDLFNASAFVLVSDRMPMASISVRGSQLSGISALKNPDQFLATVSTVINGFEDTKAG